MLRIKPHEGMKIRKMEKILCLYASNDIIFENEYRRLLWAGHVACMGIERLGFGRWTGRILEDSIKRDLREVGSKIRIEGII